MHRSTSLSPPGDIERRAVRSAAPGSEANAPTPAPRESSAILVLGGAAILAGLSAWGLGRRSYWVDEAISVGATNELVETWSGTGGTMGLYYALLTPWSWVSTDRVWLRALSVLFAVVALAFVWKVALRLAGRWAAVLAVSFTAGSWAVVRYAQEARSYTLVLLLTSASWWALVSAIGAEDEAARRRWLRWHLVAVVLAPLAHGLAVLQLLGQLTLLATSPGRKEWAHRLAPAMLGLAVVLSGLMVLGADDVASWIPPLSWSQLGDYVQVLTGPGALFVVGLGAFAALGTGVSWNRSRRATNDADRLLALVPVAWGLVPVIALLAMSVARPYLLGRYVVASAPGIALLLAFAVLGPRGAPRVGRSLVVALPIVALLVTGQVQLHDDAYDDWESAAAIVATGARPGDALAFPNPTVRMAFDYAWHERDADPGAVPQLISPVEPLDHVRRFYTVIDPSQLPAAVADAESDRVWIVAQDTEGFDPTMDPFLAQPEIIDSYVIVEEHRLDGNVRVALLERR